jgi:radical SAM protein (TIGR01212 family)
MDRPYRSHSAYLRERFGEKVRRISLDAGLPCPHREGGRGAGGCAFCDPRGSGTGAFDAGIGVPEQVAGAIVRMSRSGVRKFIAYFQAFTGTMAPIGELESLWSEAVRPNGVVGLTVSTRPDALSDPVLDLLASFAPGGGRGADLDVWIEIGLQSACDETLRRINRGHDRAAFDDAVRRAHARGLKTAAHVILGLPGETESDMFRTAGHLSRSPVLGVKMHHLYVTRGAPLAAEYRRGAVPALSLAEYIPLAVGFLRRLRPDIVIMRLCGSAPREELIAPAWDAGGGEVADLIAQAMQERGALQGDLSGEQ